MSKYGVNKSISDDLKLSRLEFHANINKPISFVEGGQIHTELKSPENGYWIMRFDDELKIGDQINYWFQAYSQNLGYRKGPETVTIKDLLDNYSLLQSKCTPAITTVNGGNPTCVGDVIIDDSFNGPMINSRFWTVEHRIPTYVEPSYEFNSYENIPTTNFFQDGKLLLKPIVSSVNNIRGTLDLRNECTAKRNFECYYESKSVFFLPPIKSARITSKISIKYGKIDVRARLPAGDWIFPIIQLQPPNPDEEHPPRIWVAYSRGNKFLIGRRPNLDIRIVDTDMADEIGSHILFAGPVLYSSEPHRSDKLVTKKQSRPFFESFHTYSLLWTPDSMVFSIDDAVYGTVDLKQRFALPDVNVGTDWITPGAPFDQEYVLSLGVAVGGAHDFPDNFLSPSGEKPWNIALRTYLKDFFVAQSEWIKTWSGDKAALEIDYVNITAI